MKHKSPEEILREQLDYDHILSLVEEGGRIEHSVIKAMETHANQFKPEPVTDEEIERWAFEKYHDVEDSRWFIPLMEGAKWMRDRMTKK